MGGGRAKAVPHFYRESGELCGRDAADRAVRSDLVVVTTPARDLLACLGQSLEPLFVQALVTELAVEALDVGVLCRAGRVVEQVAHSAAVCPDHERSAGELRPLIGTHGIGEAAELTRLLEQARDVLAADAVINGDVDALAAEVVDDGPALDPPTVGASP